MTNVINFPPKLAPTELSKEEEREAIEAYRSLSPAQKEEIERFLKGLIRRRRVRLATAPASPQE